MNGDFDSFIPHNREYPLSHINNELENVVMGNYVAECS